MRQLTFDDLRPRGIERLLRAANPWWRGEHQANVPRIRRWVFEPLARSLRSGLAPATVLRGPRQVGKSTLLNQLIEQLLADGVDPQRIFRVQFDDLPDLRRLTTPILDVCLWYADAVLGMSLNAAALQDRHAFIFLDEVQNLADWAPQLKHLVDMHPVRALVTGSSALRIEAGRDSLAGRVSTIEIGPLLLREIATFQGLAAIPPPLAPNGPGALRDRLFWQELRAFGEKHREPRAAAFAAFSARGAYPVAHARADEPWERVADFLVETVVKRAIQHDLRMGPRGQKRDETLLAEIFRLACRYIGQSPSQALYLEELRTTLKANIGWQRVLAYLRFLDGTLLLRLIEPLELRLKRKRGPAKLCLCDHALRAAWLQEAIPLDPRALRQSPELFDLAGRVADSATGYFFRSILALDVAHFPERGAEPEVDYVLTIGEQRLPIEVKYRRSITHADQTGLRSFIDKPHYHAPFGILVTLDDAAASDDPRIVSLPLSTLLMMR